MPCDTRLRQGQTLAERNQQIKSALKKLELALQQGRARVVIAPNGAVAFSGWQERDDVTDACAYRVLTAESSSALRMAVARAQATSGRQVNPQAIAAGHHSHDGGRTWSRH
jgi:ABC-type uncharacterized transport system ATPase subunit